MTGPRPSEFELIARVFAPLAGEGAFGLEDDAASWTPPAGADVVLTKDVLAAGVHFFPGDPWDGIARKALRVNLSDLAAKGADPVAYMIGLGLPDGWVTADVEAFGRGLAADQRAFGITLAGGDTIRAVDRLVVSVTAIGTVPEGGMVRRGGALAGDRLVVTGTIGDAALGLALRLDDGLADRLGLAPDHVAHLLQRYGLPQPRVVAAPALREHASAAMDVSDGLVGDLAKMAAASGVGMEIDAGAVPLSDAARAAVAADPALLLKALTGGDDYEIVAAVPAVSVGPFVRALEGAGLPAAVIGGVTPGSGVAVQGPDGRPLDVGSGSYAHF